MGREVKFSELLAPAKDTLVIYSFMFRRWSGDTRPGPAEGDYHAETPEGEQSPILNVFARDGDGFRHRWATELLFAPGGEGEETRHVDSIWPIWNFLDMTPGGAETGRTSPGCSTKRSLMAGLGGGSDPSNITTSRPGRPDDRSMSAWPVWLPDPVPADFHPGRQRAGMRSPAD